MSELTCEGVLAAFDRAMKSIAARVAEKEAIDPDLSEPARGVTEAMTPFQPTNDEIDRPTAPAGAPLFRPGRARYGPLARGHGRPRFEIEPRRSGIAVSAIARGRKSPP